MKRNQRKPALSERSESKGFALIEVIVAVAIFALSATLIVGAILNIFRTSARFSIQRQVNQEALNAKETITRNTRAALGASDQGAVSVLNEEGKPEPCQPSQNCQLSLRLNSILAETYRVALGRGGQPAIVADNIDYDPIEQPAPMDVMLVLDTSYSMLCDMEGRCPGSSTKPIPPLKIDALNDAIGTFGLTLRGFYDNLEDLRIGIVTYGSDATLFEELQTQSSIAHWMTLKIVSTNDCTNMAAGIKMAGEELAAKAKGVRQVIVLMSDGLANTIDPSISQVCRAWNKPPPPPWQLDKAPWAAILRADDLTPGVTFYTLGFGQPTPDVLDEATLKRIAQDDSRYTNANTTVALNAFFGGIPNTITNYIKGNPDPSYLTSDQVVVKDLQFELGGSSGQPYIKIMLYVTSPEEESSWKYVETRIETVVSSRDYQ